MATPAHPTQQHADQQHADQTHSNHGNTVAAWAAVGILIIAALVMCIAVVAANVWVFIVGLVLAVAGLVVGKLLSMAGYGMSRPADDTATRGVR